MYVGLNERGKTRQSVKRLGLVDDIVDGVSFYASPPPGFVTGDTMYIAGGEVGYRCLPLESEDER